ncbi:EamA family transporter [Clostridium swellfunianum]|nr:EamA family transporter [Clostridium swellfunianum]
MVLVFFNSILLACGQLLWKAGLKQESMSSIKQLIHLLLNKYMLGGIAVYIISTFYWFSILKKFDLTKVYPLQSISYIVVLFFGYLMFKEPITKNTLVGTLIIVVGVFIITKQ